MSDLLNSLIEFHVKWIYKQVLCNAVSSYFVALLVCNQYFIRNKENYQDIVLKLLSRENHVDIFFL